jgi:ABC-type amino acid transport substrate-binding protein
MPRKVVCYLPGFLICAITLAGLIRSADAAPKGPKAKLAFPLSDNERKWLREHPIIKIAPDPEFHPIEYLDEKGIYRGISADYLALLEKILGIRFTIVRLKTWSEVLKREKSREIDMFGAATKSPQRSKYMLFSKPHIELPGVIIVRKGTEGSLTMEQLLQKKVAIVKGYIWQDLLQNKFPNFKPLLVPNINTGLKEVSFGWADAFINDLATTTYFIEKEQITNLRVAGESVFYTRLGIASRKDWPELNAIIEKGLASIPPEEKKRYCGSGSALLCWHGDRAMNFSRLASLFSRFWAQSASSSGTEGFIGRSSENPGVA